MVARISIMRQQLADRQSSNTCTQFQTSRCHSPVLHSWKRSLWSPLVKSGLIYITHIWALRYNIESWETLDIRFLHSRSNGKDIIVSIKPKCRRTFKHDWQYKILSKKRCEQVRVCCTCGSRWGYLPGLYVVCVTATQAVSQSVTAQHVPSGFPPWSNMLSRTSVTPALLKFQVFEKGKASQISVSTGDV